MLEDGPPFCILESVGAKEQSTMLHPTGGKWPQAGLVKGAMFSDSGAKEVLMRSNDAAFAMWTLGIVSGGENSGTAVQQGQLRRKMLTDFLDKATEQAPHILPI